MDLEGGSRMGESGKQKVGVQTAVQWKERRKGGEARKVLHWKKAR